MSIQEYKALETSFGSFNGSGYADLSSPTAMVDSYIDYCLWKKRNKYAKLAHVYREALLVQAAHLIKDGQRSHVPSEKHLADFRAFRNKPESLF